MLTADLLGHSIEVKGAGIALRSTGYLAKSWFTDACLKYMYNLFLIVNVDHPLFVSHHLCQNISNTS